jgi:hypothetical protein
VDRIFRSPRLNASCLGYSSLLATVLLVGSGTGTLAAAETETRRFAIQIDGKPAGSYQMIIRQEADGAVVSSHAHAKVKLGFITLYHYSYLGTETWKNGRLTRLDSTTNDNGDEFTLNAEAQGDNLRLKVNDKERTVSGKVWTTSYWRLTDSSRMNTNVPLLDPDSGKETIGKLEQVGKTEIMVGGKKVSCTQYRLSGSVQVDLWFDAAQRLLRQDSMEDGHRTVLQLEEITR